MKRLSILFFAVSFAGAADDKPKAPPPPSPLTLEEHADLLLTLAVQLQANFQEIADARDGKLGFEVQKAAQNARQQFSTKHDALRASHNAPATCQSPQGPTENRWNFMERKWSCAPASKDPVTSNNSGATKEKGGQQ